MTEEGVEGQASLRKTGLNKTQLPSLLQDLKEPLIVQYSLSISNSDRVYNPIGIWNSSPPPHLE